MTWKGREVQRVTAIDSDTIGDFGRNLLGLAAITFGLIALVSGDFNNWQRIDVNFLPGRHALVYATALAQILGGIALQWRRTSLMGAAVLVAVYVIFSFSHLPHLFALPFVYARWGGLFEQLSILAGAILVLASATRKPQWRRVALGIGRTLFSMCVISFCLYQAFYIPDTASLVPKWIPSGQAFWAIATTGAFALAAIAILARYLDVLASLLMTVMILLFQVLIWLPALAAHPTSQEMWAGNAQNLAIAASAWIFTRSISSRRSELRSGAIAPEHAI